MTQRIMIMAQAVDEHPRLTNAILAVEVVLGFMAIVMWG